MPVYTYRSKNPASGCSFCREPFDYLHKSNTNPLARCPRCAKPVIKLFSGFAVGGSKTGFDQKAKEKGFHKLKKVDKGKYEKLY